MNKLTEIQRNFILNEFFYNTGYPGWKNIANKLLDKGTCIVAGKDCIWKGGVGNFIRLDEEPEFVDCSRYTFNIKDFMLCTWYKETLDLRFSDNIDKIEALQKINKELKEIRNGNA